MKVSLNLNTILGALGGLGVFAPDLVVISTWLASMHVAWLAYPIRGISALALFFTAAPLVVPRLRSFLALLGLATPPGALAPWDPKRDEAPTEPRTPRTPGNGG